MDPLLCIRSRPSPYRDASLSTVDNRQQTWLVEKQTSSIRNVHTQFSCRVSEQTSVQIWISALYPPRMRQRTESETSPSLPDMHALNVSAFLFLLDWNVIWDLEVWHVLWYDIFF